MCGQGNSITIHLHFVVCGQIEPVIFYQSHGLTGVDDV